MPSASEVNQLVEMGIERALAEAALKKYGRASDAAEAILEGRFEMPDAAVEAQAHEAPAANGGRPHEEDDDMDEEDGDAFEDDSDDDVFGAEEDSWSVGSIMDEHKDDDPYKDIIMSKDRVKTTIEVEQSPRTYTIDGTSVVEVTQSEWMKGCPEGNEQSLLFGIFQQWTEDVPCPTCRHNNPRNDHTSLLNFWPTLRQFINHSRTVVQRQCISCSVTYCSICGELAHKDHNSSSNVKGKEEDDDVEAVQDVLLHCPELQSLLLGVGLGHIERNHLDESKAGISAAAQQAINSGTKRKSPAAQTNTTYSDDGDDDDHYTSYLTKKSKSAPSGTGYAGSSSEAKVWASAVMLKQQQNDKALAEALALLRNFLPTLTRQPNPVSSDYMPHTTTLAHLRRRFLPVASKLLQSDSLIDMSERSILYEELLLWLQIMSNNETLAALVAQPIMLQKNVENKPAKDGTTMEKHVHYSGGAGPRELLQSVVGQCLTVLDRMDRQQKALAAAQEKLKKNDDKDQSTEDDKPDADQTETDKLLTFCSNLVATTHRIDSLLRKTKGDAMVDKLLGVIAPDSQAALEAAVDSQNREEQSEEQRKQAYETWVKSLQYSDADLSIEAATSSENQPSISSYQRWRHIFNSEINATPADNSKRTMAIAKELASLQVSLPALWHGSIFLRVDESRIDVLKACIVGPEDSPYESGLFFFDIFLPSTYNSEPPKVKIITTHDGRHRFNPNLYADGKVCLSLLGTWHGPGWVKGRSTLLQVLLSIQSLIMGESEPVVNEPGWSNQRGTAASMAYNKNLRRMTVATAMLRNLNEPPHPWKDVVEGHFRAKGKDIIKLTEKWLQEDDGQPLKGDGAHFMSGTRAGSSTDTPADGQFKKNIASLHEAINKLQV